MEELSFNQFCNNVLKRGSHQHKITHCYGVRDAYNWCSRNKWKHLNKCSNTLYKNVITQVNKQLLELILDGHIIELPYGMGEFKMVSTKGKVYNDNGKIRNNYSIDWKSTLQYWHEDKEAFQEKSIIKMPQKYKSWITWGKAKSRIKNKCYYKFRANRSAGIKLSQKQNKTKVIGQMI